MKLENLSDTFPVLDIGDYILREWRLDDALDAFAFRSDPDADKFWMHAPPDVEEMRDWIEGYISRFYRQTGLYWAIADKEDDSVIGMCHFVNWDHNHCRVGVGFFLAKSHWNQGIMTSARRGYSELWIFIHEVKSDSGIHSGRQSCLTASHGKGRFSM